MKCEIKLDQKEINKSNTTNKQELFDADYYINTQQSDNIKTK